MTEEITKPSIKVEEIAQTTKVDDEQKSVLIGTRIKDIVHAVNVNATSDFIDALNKYVVSTCMKAVERCKENGRKTVKPCDL
jgi:histone H3/H4